MIWLAELVNITPQRFPASLVTTGVGTTLLRALHSCAGCDSTRNTAQEVVAPKESSAHRHNKSAVGRSRARDSRRIIRDVSASLDMTGGRLQLRRDTR